MNREAREQIELIEEQEAAEREAEESDDESTGAEDTTRVLALSEYRPLWEVVATGAPPAVQAQQTRHEVRPQPSDTAEREAEEERIKLIDAVGLAFREMDEDTKMTPEDREHMLDVEAVEVALREMTPEDKLHPLSEYWPPWEITRNMKTARDARDQSTRPVNALNLRALKSRDNLRALKSMSLAPQRGQSGYLAVNALNLDGRSAKMIDALHLDGHRMSPPPPMTLAERQESSTAARAAVTFAEIGRRRQEKQRRATESLLLRTAEAHGGSAATVERVAASESAPAGAATVTEESMEQQLQFLKQQQLQFARACMEAQGSFARAFRRAVRESVHRACL